MTDHERASSHFKAGFDAALDIVIEAVETARREQFARSSFLVALRGLQKDAADLYLVFGGQEDENP